MRHGGALSGGHLGDLILVLSADALAFPWNSV